MGKVGLLHKAALRLQAARPERPVGLRSVSAPRRGRRRADRDPLDVVRHRQSHAGDLRGEQRLSHARLSGGGGVDLLRPGLRGRQPADVRRAARQPLAAHRRREQLVERLSARAASGRGAQHAAARRSATCSRRPSSTRRRRPPASRPSPSSIAGTWPSAARDDALRKPACAATSWPRACSWRFPRRPIWPRKRPQTHGLYGVDRKECADFAPGLPAGPAAARARRALRAALERRGLRHRGPLGRPRQRARTIIAASPTRSTGPSPACCAICGSGACSTTRW